ncbi:hypothetical protein E2C01_081245 [Portunus trituberculatus]|uniref:Uncharacterized protein n=1 Tax=Portunus trituberculatus TaxID=210409 RepID=A0A5B7IW45_PORTR|nr:hypothetical protein [Portunus trituberculatus]
MIQHGVPVYRTPATQCPSLPREHDAAALRVAVTGGSEDTRLMAFKIAVRFQVTVPGSRIFLPSTMAGVSPSSESCQRELGVCLPLAEAEVENIFPRNNYRYISRRDSS